MAFQSQAAPAGATDIVHAALVSRLQRAQHLPALQGSPQTGTPLPSYVLDRVEASRDAPLSAARRVGWRYPIVGGASPGLATLIGEQQGLTFAGVSHGPLAERLMQAATLVEDNLGSKQEQFEPRLLEIPSLRICALWLYGGSQNFFVVLVDGQRPGEPELQLERDIQPRIAAALAGMRSRSAAARTAAPGRQRAGAKKWNVRIPLLLLSGLALATAFGSGWIAWPEKSPLTAWLIELAWMSGLFVTIGLGIKGWWFGVLVDGRNKISLSRLQLVLWTILFSATFLVIYVWNVGHTTGEIAGALSLMVPNAAWLLMGMSGVSAAGSPAILSAKPVPDQAALPPPQPADGTKFIDGTVVKRKMGETPRWSDIILGDDAGNADAIDISKVQQLLLSLVAIAVYGYAIAEILTAAKGIPVPKLADMDSGFLALIGVSHATYLVYKGVPHTN
jgi:hypothetical protein